MKRKIRKLNIPSKVIPLELNSQGSAEKAFMKLELNYMLQDTFCFLKYRIYQDETIYNKQDKYKGMSKAELSNILSKEKADSTIFKVVFKEWNLINPLIKIEYLILLYCTYSDYDLQNQFILYHVIKMLKVLEIKYSKSNLRHNILSGLEVKSFYYPMIERLIKTYLQAI